MFFFKKRRRTNERLHNNDPSLDMIIISYLQNTTIIDTIEKGRNMLCIPMKSRL